MAQDSNKKRAFCVIQFIDLPFEGIDDYVCVPSTWLIVRRPMDQRAVVAYPKDEDPFDTRDRAKRKERYNDEWRFYMAAVKYESDSYRDAEYWIATRNDYGPLVEEKSKIEDTQSRSTLKKKLRNANRSNSSKFNDNPQKPLPRISIKRPALSEPTKHHNGKRLKLSKLRRQQELSRLPMEVDTPTHVIDTDREVQTNSNIEQHLSSDRVLRQFAEHSKPVQELQMSVTPSIEMISNDQEPLTNDVLNNVPTSHHLPNSLKMSTNLCSHIDGARLLIPIQKPLEKKIRLMSIERNFAVSAQTPLSLMDQTGSLPSRSVEQPTVVTQNQSQDSQQELEMHTQNSRYQTTQLRGISISSQGIQHVPTINIERSNDVAAVDPKNVLQSVTNDAATSQNLPGSSHMHPSFFQSSARHQNSLAHEQEPLRVSTGSKNYDHRPNSRSIRTKIQKKMQQPIKTKKLISIREAISTIHNIYLRNVQQFQASRSGSVLVPESDLEIIDNSCETDDCMVEETPSPYYGGTSDSAVVTGHEVISDHEMSADESPVEISNNAYWSGIASRSNSADRPTAAQNQTSTNDQTHHRTLLERQMLDNFASLLTQMGSTLRYTCDMFNNLRDSIHVTAQTYRNLLQTYRCLLDAVDRFKTEGNSASNASPSRNLTPQTLPATEERHIRVTVTANSSNGDQNSDNVANKAPKKKHNNSWRPVLPPEYDPHDTRWTLKYRTNLPGLVELMPQSGIYVSYGDLKYCQHVSKDCKSLAVRMLLAVFNRKALSVCLSMSEKAQASNNVRPGLDEHATSVLLNFVLKHGLQHGWNTDVKPVLSTLHIKIIKIRSKYGVMVKC